MRFKNPRLIYIPLAVLMVMGVLFTGCSRDSGLAPADIGQVSMTDNSTVSTEKSLSGFALEVKTDSIMSYPTGGGVYILRLLPDEGFTGTVNLSVSATNRLNAELEKSSVTAGDAIAEVTIKPTRSIDIGVHEITVTATFGGESQTLTLKANVVDWFGSGTGVATQKRDAFIDWLHAEHPELGTFSSQNWFAYAPYPGILVVSHWTYLNEDWEMRICYHVMIPPYDWSKMLLRRRGEWDPILAAKMETDGSIHEIPIEEY